MPLTGPYVGPNLWIHFNNYTSRWVLRVCFFVMLMGSRRALSGAREGREGERGREKGLGFGGRTELI